MGLERFARDHERDMLQIGVGGRLLCDGGIKNVLPLEDAAAYAAANPVAGDGRIRFDRERLEARQDAQVRLLLKGEPFELIILGGSHDLSDNIARLSEGKAEYIRVELEAWRGVAGESRPTSQ